MNIKNFKGLLVLLVFLVVVVMLSASEDLLKEKEHIVDLSKKEKLTLEEQKFVDSLSLEVLQEYNYPDTNVVKIVTEFKKIKEKGIAKKLGYKNLDKFQAGKTEVIIPKIALTKDGKIIKYNEKGEKVKTIQLKKKNKYSQFTLSPKGTMVVEVVPTSTMYENEDGELYFYDNEGNFKWKRKGDYVQFSTDDRIVVTSTYATGIIRVYADGKKVYEMESPGRYYEDGTGIETIAHTAFGRNIWGLLRRAGQKSTLYIFDYNMKLKWKKEFPGFGDYLKISRVDDIIIMYSSPTDYIIDNKGKIIFKHNYQLCDDYWITPNKKLFIYLNRGALIVRDITQNKVLWWKEFSVNKGFLLDNHRILLHAINTIIIINIYNQKIVLKKELPMGFKPFQPQNILEVKNNKMIIKNKKREVVIKLRKER